MKIGIIGAGQIGGTLTRRLTALGHKVFVANSRTKRAKTALRNGAAPRTAPVASPLLLERALAGCFRPAANHEIMLRFTGCARHWHPWGQGSCAQPQLSGRASIRADRS
jgi:3-hydroxyisobutyrate dehydrogenase-like beta-hydroxyacid dehydrogenase